MIICFSIYVFVLQDEIRHLFSGVTGNTAMAVESNLLNYKSGMYVLDVFQADIEIKILEMDKEIKVRAKISEAAKFYRNELVSHAF